MQSLESAR